MLNSKKRAQESVDLNAHGLDADGLPHKNIRLMSDEKNSLNNVNLGYTIRYLPKKPSYFPIENDYRYAD